MTRHDAREAIVDAARKHRQRRIARIRSPFLPKAFTMRHLQQCVHVCRAHRLVKDDVLVAAGFRPNRPIRKVTA